MPYTSILKMVLPTSSAKFLVTLILVQVVGAFFTVYVYGALTSLGDGIGYLEENLEFNYSILKNRTLLVKFLFGNLGNHFNLLESCLIGGVIFAGVVFFMFKDIRFFIPNYLFWPVLILPTFLVYTGLPSKEFLAILFFLPLVQAAAQLNFDFKVNWFLLLVFLLLGFMVRFHYWMAYFWLVLVSVIYFQKKIDWIPFLGIVLFLAFIIFFVGNYDWMNRFFVERVARFSAGDSFRSLEWNNIFDFGKYAWWGVPFAIIGPLPMEVLDRPKLVLPFLTGLFSFCLMLYFWWTIKKMLPFQVWFYGFTIGLILLLWIHYPFGLFNPGAGFRYKQNLAPFLYFYPLFVIGYYNKKKSESNSTD